MLLLNLLLSVFALARAYNPITRTEYTADPAPIVYKDRIYVYTGHDENASTNYNMKEWLLFSSNDMANWHHHGSPMNLSSFTWADENAWAGQVVHRNDKFYFYVPVPNKATTVMAIGVGVSNSIEGPLLMLSVRRWLRTARLIRLCSSTTTVGHFFIGETPI